MTGEGHESKSRSIFINRKEHRASLSKNCLYPGRNIGGTRRMLQLRQQISDRLRVFGNSVSEPETVFGHVLFYLACRRFSEVLLPLSASR